jgi:arylsulfatase A-like enzyme
MNRFIFVSTLACALLAWVACASAEPKPDAAEAVARDQRLTTLQGSFGAPAVPALHPGGRRLLCVMVDGLPVRLFERGLAAQVMPNLQRLMDERPTVRTTALSTFPSSTSPSVPEMLSGSYAREPEPTRPAAVHAFDREQLTVVRYLTKPAAWEWPVPDLFDAAAAAGLTSITVAEGRWSGTQTILTRGANLRDAALEALGIGSYQGDRAPVAHLDRALENGDEPDVTFLVLNGVDLVGHFHGPDSTAALRALYEVDRRLGDVLDRLRATRLGNGRSLLDDTTVLFFGDHGMVQSGTFIDLKPWFERRGLVTYDASSLFQVFVRERFGHTWTHWPDALLVAGGSNVTQVYLRPPSGGWAADQTGKAVKIERAETRPSDLEMAREIVELPGVEQVLRWDDENDRVELVASGDRVSWVETRNDGGGAERYAYVVPDAAVADPLDYLADTAIAPLVCRASTVDDRCFRDQESWQRATAAAKFPAAVPVVPKAVRPGRFTGQLIVTAQKGYTFLKGQNGDHGNLEREAMTTPFLLNGPGVVPSAHPTLVRLVDLYPTAAVLLGADPNDPALASLDGRALPCVEPPSPEAPSAMPARRVAAVRGSTMRGGAARNGAGRGGAARANTSRSVVD